MSDTDLLLVGGGLANTLIALRLKQLRPELNVLMLEREGAIGGNHTWSFHGTDLSAAQRDWVLPLAEYHWDDYEVRFPQLCRQLGGSYHSITSDRLARIAGEQLGDSIRCNSEISELSPDGVRLTDGTELRAQAVIDGRGPVSSPHLDVRFQKFVGQIVELDGPHGLTGPVIMDATESQDDGYRFFYSLPFDERRVLIEDTRYSDAPAISADTYGAEIQRYADRQGWSINRILRVEEGILPITLDGDIAAFWDADPAPIARSGLRAALFHPATGYSLPDAVRLADSLADLGDYSAPAVYRCTRAASEALWQHTRFYRALNRMLFLAAAPAERRRVMERFYGLNENLIQRFYAGQNTFTDKSRILIGKPPVGLGRAFSAVFMYSSQQQATIG